MSVEALAVCLHHSRAKGTARLVLLGIANHDGDGGSWPAVATLAKYAGGVTTRNVQKAIGRLVELGEVAVDVQAGGTRDTRDELRPNRYRVLLSCPAECDRSTQHRTGRQLRILDPHPLSVATPPVGSDTPPLSVATPHPLSVATPEPSYQPPHNASSSSPSHVQTARPVVDNPEQRAAAAAAFAAVGLRPPGRLVADDAVSLGDPGPRTVPDLDPFDDPTSPVRRQPRFSPSPPPRDSHALSVSPPTPPHPSTGTPA